MVNYQHDIMILVMCHPKPEISDTLKEWLHRHAPRGRIKLICNPKVSRNTMFNKALRDILENQNSFSKIMIVHDDVEPIEKETKKIFECPYDITGCKFDDGCFEWVSPMEWTSAMVIFKREVVESFIDNKQPFFEDIYYKRNGEDVLVYDHCRSIARRAFNFGYTMGHVGLCEHAGRQRWRK